MSEFKDEDLQVIVGCAAAHPDQRGGQHVARHCTSVLVIHKPTGIGVRVDGRSQHANRLRAVERLRLILEDMQVTIDVMGEDW